MDKGNDSMGIKEHQCEPKARTDECSCFVVSIDCFVNKQLDFLFVHVL